MPNVYLGATHEVDPDQTGVPEGAIRLKSGNIYKTDAEGRPIIPQVSEEAPVSTRSFSRTIAKGPDEESQTETTQEAVDASGNVVAKHTVVSSPSKGVISESQSGDVSLLGIEPKGGGIGTLLVGAGLIAGAYFMFKG